MPDTPLVSAVAPAAAGGAGLLATTIGSLGGPAGAAIGAGVGALITLIGDIGSGRRTANSFTQKGGPQDVVNRQLAAISASTATDAEKQQATQMAWSQFIDASNQFASQGKEQAQVAKQAIFQTPGLTDTVKSLGGFDPLGQEYTSKISPSIPNATKQSGITAGQFVAPVAAGIGGAVAGSQINGNVSQGTTVGDVNAGTQVNADGSISPAGPVGDAGPSIPAGVAMTTATPPAGSTSPSLFSKLFPTLVASGTSLLGGVLGSSAAKSAADVQAAASTHAADLAAEAGANSLAFQKQVFNQQQANVQPWIDSGTTALKSIADINANPYKLPTAEEALQTPGLQFQLQQGQKALEEYERQNGTLLSGKAIKDINTFAQGTAEQGYNNLVNQQLAARSANLNPLLSVAGLGQTSVGQLNNTMSNAANTNANTQQTTAVNVGNQQTNAAAATASGYVGSSNALVNALSQVGNNISGQQSISQLLAALKPAA